MTCSQTSATAFSRLRLCRDLGGNARRQTEVAEQLMPKETKTAAGSSNHAELAPASTPTPPAVVQQSGLPAVIPPRPELATRRRFRPLLLLVLVAAAAGGGWWWWAHRATPLPPWIAYSNGRLEADEVDINSKFAGRVAEIDGDEGTMVTAGQIVARMDTRDLAASLAQAELQIEQARHTATSAQADLQQQAVQVKLAAQELQRARTLVPRGFETQEVLDQRQATFDAAMSTFNSDQEKLNAALAAQQAAEHNADLIRTNIADNTLVAPKHGPISTASPISARCCRRAARFSPCLMSITSTWTFFCQLPKLDASCSGRLPASCSMHCLAGRLRPQ